MKLRSVFAVLCLCAALIGSQKMPPAHGYMNSPAPVALEGVTVAVIGDSYTGGSNDGGLGDQGWPMLAKAELARLGTPVTFSLHAVGGSGYANPGPSKLTFGGVIPVAVESVDRLVVLFGSRNDINEIQSDAAAYAVAVRSAFGKVRLLAPAAKILVIGPPWVNSNPPPAMLQMRDSLQAQAEAAGVTFVDPIAEQWFVGQSGLIGSDGVHPTDAGHVYMAQKITPLIAKQLAP